MARRAQASERDFTRKGQHFLLTAEARSMSVPQIAAMRENEVHDLFRTIRWAHADGEPECPHCKSRAVHAHASRRIFSCKQCVRQFSVTSCTAFHATKLPLRTILLAVLLFTNGAKGYSALQLSRDLGCQYKTAYVLLHKLRECLGPEIEAHEASGEVEVDGGYFGGYVKPANHVENRVDRRRAENQTGKRQVMVVMREREGRTVTTVVKREGDAVDQIAKRVKPGTIVHADEARSWDPLHYEGFEMRRINHQQAYSDNDACTNGAESFISRIRRAEIGTHHHIAGPYLRSYAHEMAWREDSRRLPNGTQVQILIQFALTQPKSVHFRGYWQRRKGTPRPVMDPLTARGRPKKR
jgi:transposase-like protein